MRKGSPNLLMGGEGLPSQIADKGCVYYTKGGVKCSEMGWGGGKRR